MLDKNMELSNDFPEQIYQSKHTGTFPHILNKKIS